MGVGDYDVKPFTLPVEPSPLAYQVRNNDNLLRAKFVEHQADVVAHPTSGATLPASGEEGQIFVDTSTSTIYIWHNGAWEPLGGGASIGHYGAFSDYTDQFAAAVNTAYAITLNTTDLSAGVSVVSSSLIKFT